MSSLIFRVCGKVLMLSENIHVVVPEFPAAKTRVSTQPIPVFDTLIDALLKTEHDL